MSSLPLNIHGLFPSPAAQFNLHKPTNHMKSTILRSLTLLAAALLSSCAGGPNAQTGTLIGAGTGALAGGIIGHQSGNTAAGALIGGVAGGAVGNAVGNNADQRRGTAVRYDAYGRPYYPRY